MMIRSRFLRLTLLVATLVSGSFAQAQAPRGGGAPPAAPTAETAALNKVGDALGSRRTTRFANARSVIAYMFTASGSMSEPAPGGRWTSYRVSRFTGEYSYHPFSAGVARSPGMRWDIERTDPDGRNQHRILAAAGNVGWDQQDITGTATPVSAAITADRMRQIWLSPHGLVWAGTTNDGGAAAPGVTTAQRNGQTVLTIPVDGAPVTVTLDKDNRPAHVEAQINHPVLGKTRWEAEYSDYKDLEDAYLVFFPGRIVHKLGGRTVLDLSVTEGHTNPYVVFPLPSGIAGGATAK